MFAASVCGYGAEHMPRGFLSSITFFVTEGFHYSSHRWLRRGGWSCRQAAGDDRPETNYKILLMVRECMMRGALLSQTKGKKVSEYT